MFVGVSGGRFLSQRHVALVSPCPNCHGWMIWSGLLIFELMILIGFSKAIFSIEESIKALTKFNANACAFFLYLNHRAPDTDKCVQGGCAINKSNLLLLIIPKTL